MNPDLNPDSNTYFTAPSPEIVVKLYKMYIKTEQNDLQISQTHNFFTK